MTYGFRVKVRGLAELTKAMNAKEKSYSTGFERGIRDAGLFLQRRSQMIVPVDTGLLRSTAKTKKEGRGFKTKIIVSYGTSYGIFVHERLDLYHAPPTRAKFLEQPFRQYRQLMIGIIARETKKKRRAK